MAHEGRYLCIMILKSPNLLFAYNLHMTHTLGHVHQHQSPHPHFLPYS